MHLDAALAASPLGMAERRDGDCTLRVIFDTSAESFHLARFTPIRSDDEATDAEMAFSSLGTLHEDAPEHGYITTTDDWEPTRYTGLMDWADNLLRRAAAWFELERFLRAHSDTFAEVDALMRSSRQAGNCEDIEFGPLLNEIMQWHAERLARVSHVTGEDSHEAE